MFASESSQVASSVLGEVFHVAYAVDDLTRAADSLIALSGGTVTDPVRIEALVVAPALSADPVRVSGRLCWVLGDEPPVELWEGGAESPWFCPAGGMRFHHIAYYVDDLNAAARSLEEQGFTLDLAPYHDGEGIFGFAYFRNAGGLRIEIQNINDKPAMDAWLRGEPLQVDWFAELQ
ncbi:VOC family protein [Streptomyces sp. NBC_00257]|uniref:VOC family protein n=1 Tax=unclassified Streptomyces TaxID=2593676 RepID=UPI0022582FD0|nr:MULTISPECIES: VOC family protein [unclassified Streptomyces]MCX4870998.1 VOC family protein [Streptomyces sp. NBC_00906]MCX4901738.1 VOC family protein [Streptomyces sp. NBC_00892]MCX5426980.1 VOC family protein [Streptomyces sp. NBC_00062]